MDIEAGLRGLATELATAEVEPALTGLIVNCQLSIVNLLDAVDGIFHDVAEPHVPGPYIPGFTTTYGNVERCALLLVVQVDALEGAAALRFRIPVVVVFELL